MKQALSVIIPTYNVERFIEKAIQSALEQKEVTEIIVVDDGSTDSTVQLIMQLKNENSIITLYQHPNKVNKGRSATRNLGIQKATGDFIAFLDADDYYLPNRFTNDFKLFQEIKDCDGVYNAIGVFFYDKAVIDNTDNLELYSVNQKVKPEDLFYILLSGKMGHFSIDGLTIKKYVFDVVGLFNEQLVVSEDTELIWKMAIKCRLETGNINDALAIRGVHGANVFNNKELYSVYILKMYESLLRWCARNQVGYKIKDALLKRIWILKEKEKNKLHQDIKYWGGIFFSNYQLFFSILSIKYFPVVRFRQTLFPFLYRLKNN